MQDSKGNTLAVGQTVNFDVWDTSKEVPTRSTSKGTITALTGESLDNQRLGEVTITAGKSTVTHPAQAVTITK